MFVPTLKVVDSFTDIFKRGDEFRDVPRIGMSQPKLTFRIIFTKRVNQTLSTNEESKVLTTSSSSYFYFLRKWHPHWNTKDNSIFIKGPGICFSIFCSGKIQISRSRYRANLEVLLIKEI